MDRGDVISFLCNIDALIFVAFFAYKVHRYKIETSALLDKTVMTIIFSAFVGSIKSALLLLGSDACDQYVRGFSVAQDVSFFAISTCVGIYMWQLVKRYKNESKQSS